MKKILKTIGYTLMTGIAALTIANCNDKEDRPEPENTFIGTMCIERSRAVTNYHDGTSDVDETVRKDEVYHNGLWFSVDEKLDDDTAIICVDSMVNDDCSVYNELAPIGNSEHSWVWFENLREAYECQHQDVIGPHVETAYTELETVCADLHGKGNGGCIDDCN